MTNPAASFWTMDIHQIAENLGLTRVREHTTEDGYIDQMTVYGTEYDGTNRNGEPDKVRITRLTRPANATEMTGDGWQVLSLTGNNDRVNTAFLPETISREGATEFFVEKLGEVA